MSLFTRGKVWLSADRANWIEYNEGTGLISIAVGGVEVVKVSSSQVTLPAGMQFGDGVGDLVGFFGATPVDQPAATAQSAVATTALTAVASTTLTAGDLTAINAAITRVGALTTYVAQTRLDLIELGLQKGSAAA